jgi:hypothetical protein
MCPDSPHPRYEIFLLCVLLYNGIEDGTSACIRCGKRMTIDADQWVRRVICQCALEKVSMKEHKSWGLHQHPKKIKRLWLTKVSIMRTDKILHCWRRRWRYGKGTNLLVQGQDFLIIRWIRVEDSFGYWQQNFISEFRGPRANFKWISATLLRQFVITSHPSALLPSYSLSACSDSALQSLDVAKMDGRIAVKWLYKGKHLA